MCALPPKADICTSACPLRANSGRIAKKVGLSHRWPEPVLAVIDARSLKRSVLLLLRSGDEDFRPRRDLAFVARHISNDDGVGGDEDLLLSVLVFQGQQLSIDSGRRLFDIGVGHRTLWSEIPGVAPFARSAHRLGEDMHLDCLLASVGLWHSS